ncbi:MAG: sigma-70 family RNA polymerase sigma factor [Pirellulales bacterium]
MPTSDSALQGPARFHSTQWSVVLRAKDLAADDRITAMSDLFRRYWYPLYSFCRGRGGNHHDAEDATQGFFLQLMNNEDCFAAVSQDKGRFRAFLLASFKNFLANQYRNASTLRRGGNVEICSIDSKDFIANYNLDANLQQTPEQLFEFNYVKTLLSRVRARLEEDYQQANKVHIFTLLIPHLTNVVDGLPRTEIGKLLNLSPAAVNMSIHRMRRRYGEILRDEVLATLDDPRDLDDELRYLFSIAGTIK